MGIDINEADFDFLRHTRLLVFHLPDDKEKTFERLEGVKNFKDKIENFFNCAKILVAYGNQIRKKFPDLNDLWIEGPLDEVDN